MMPDGNMTTDSACGASSLPREASLAMGGDSLANHLARDLEGSVQEFLQRLWDGACLWKALAIQMVVGNSAVCSSGNFCDLDLCVDGYRKYRYREPLT